MKFRNDIQGLRAIAVIYVFIFHLSSNLLPGGFIGVDIFFVISGYLVSNIVYSKINKGTFSIFDFYRSRIQRIVPAYLFLLVAVSIVASFLFIKSDVLVFRKSLFWTLLFNSNNHFASLDSYFGASSSENPLLHTWTLAVEMQFYLILPIILLAVRNKKKLVILLCLLTVCFFAYSTFGISNGEAGIMYFSLPSRIPEFLIGILGAVIKIEDLAFVKRNTNIISTFGLIVLFASAFLLSEKMPFPGITALLPCIGTLALLVSNTSRINTFFSKKVFVFIGEISYSVYLWHWPIMAFLRYHNNTYDFSFGEKTAIIILTFILSLISYYFVEKRLRKAKRLAFNGPFLLLGGTVAAMVILVPKINGNVFKSKKEFMSPSFGLDSHGATFKKVETFGDTVSNKKRILLLGDSHALCMKKYLDIVGEDNGFSFRTITNNTYPTLPGLTSLQINNSLLLDRYNNLMKYVNLELPKADIIILQFAGDGHQWKNQLKILLSKMRENQKLVLIADFPGVDKNPVRINRDIVKRNDIEQKYTLIYKKMSSDILKIIESDKRCRYIDLTKNLVFTDAPFYHDTLMYYDQWHLNAYGAKVYAKATENKLMNLLNFELK